MPVNTMLALVEERQPIEKTRYEPPEPFVPRRDGYLPSHLATCGVDAVVEPVVVPPRVPRRWPGLDWYAVGVIAVVLLAAVASAVCLLSAAPPLPD